MDITKRLTMMAGLQYLAVGILGGFAQGFVTSKIYVAGSPAASAEGALQNLTLMRFGIIADLAQATIFVFLALTLYRLLGHLDESAGRAMVTFVAISAAIMCLNNVFQYVALTIAEGGALSDSFGPSGSQNILSLLIELHHYGFLIAQIFFGLWLAPLGYLAKKSGAFSKALCLILQMAAVGYVLDVILLFLSPNFGARLNPVLLSAPIIGEVWMVGHLLFLGLNRRTLRLSVDIVDVAPAVLLEKDSKEAVK